MSSKQPPENGADPVAAFCRELNEPLEIVINMLYVAAHESSDPQKSRQLVRLAYERLEEVRAVLKARC